MKPISVPAENTPLAADQSLTFSQFNLAGRYLQAPESSTCNRLQVPHHYRHQSSSYLPAWRVGIGWNYLACWMQECWGEEVHLFVSLVRSPMRSLQCQLSIAISWAARQALEQSLWALTLSHNVMQMKIKDKAVRARDSWLIKRKRDRVKLLQIYI